ncbi:hypothetical protein [uncultured Microbulbifer sp.]|uniref:hypothetical protein n=1 Tax=uncultured Microbulbifer sp. TaxID=348147 RepID=UPI00261D1375|nr:hypothetical protein [uncultured Microbulbifer sp.]
MRELDIKVKGHNCLTFKKNILRKTKGKPCHFWGCRGYSDCKAIFPNKGNKLDFNSKSKFVGKATDYTCPECEKGKLVKRMGKLKKTKKAYNWYGCD